MSQNRSKEMGSNNQNLSKKPRAWCFVESVSKVWMRIHADPSRAFLSRRRTGDIPKPILQGLHFLIPKPDKKGNGKKNPTGQWPWYQLGLTPHKNELCAVANHKSPPTWKDGQPMKVHTLAEGRIGIGSHGVFCVRTMHCFMIHA